MSDYKGTGGSQITRDLADFMLQWLWYLAIMALISGYMRFDIRLQGPWNISAYSEIGRYQVTRDLGRYQVTGDMKTPCQRVLREY